MKTIIPLPFVYPYVIVFVVAYVLAFYQEWQVLGKRKPRAGETRPQDRGSYALIAWGIAFSAVAASFCAVMVPQATIRHERVPCFWVGMAVMVVGGILRRHSFAMLGGHFQPVVNVVAGQPAIEKGLYRWIRHPSYLAAFFCSWESAWRSPIGSASPLFSWLRSSVTVIEYTWRNRPSWKLSARPIATT